MEEIWKPIDGYPNYCVSNKGNVKSLNYHRTGKEKVLKFGTNKKGYLYVGICKNRKMKVFTVHRLVAGAFPEICGELFEGCEVDHIDTNKENNNADNLRCVTPRENTNNPLTKIHKSEAQKGKFNTKCSKPVLQIDKITNEVIAEFPSVNEVQRQLGFNAGHISACCLKKPHRNTAYKFIWKYKN